MKQKIEELLQEAMKKGDKPKVTLYRGLKADIQTAEMKGETNILNILIKSAKSREDAIQEYLEAGRTDLADVEIFEHSLICKFLPKAPTDEEIIEEIKVTSEQWGKNMGLIIKAVKAKYPTVDGKKLATMVKGYLNE